MFGFTYNFRIFRSRSWRITPLFFSVCCSCRISIAEKSSVSAAAVPAACPVTAQQGITRMMSHMASVTEVHRPAMIRFFTLAEYSVENGALSREGADERMD